MHNQEEAVKGFSLSRGTTTCSVACLLVCCSKFKTTLVYLLGLQKCNEISEEGLTAAVRIISYFSAKSNADIPSKKWKGKIVPCRRGSMHSNIVLIPDFEIAVPD